MKYTIDTKGLKSYLESLKETDFRDEDGGRGTNPSGIIKRAQTRDDIEFFKMDKSKITLDCFIDYGMPFLCDVLGNDLSIVELSRKKHKMQNGRVLRMKFIATVIKDCRKTYGTCLNGYWIIPDQFLKIK
jgi:hypothetical protein